MSQDGDRYFAECHERCKQLEARLADLIAAADAVVYRPAVDDSRAIDRDLRNLREVTNRVRAADSARLAQGDKCPSE